MKLYQKFILIFIIFLIQAFGIIAYVKNELFITEFKKEYLWDIYLPILQYKLEQAFPHKSFTAYSSATADAIPVLLYHSILTEPDGQNVLSPNFTSQMITLKKAGYNTITIEDFYEFMKANKSLPEKSILITFDDGPKNSYYPVDPVLKALDFNAVSYIITKYALVDKSKFYLTFKELQEMNRSGHWELQFHAKDGHTFYIIGKNGKKGRFYPNKFWLSNQNRLETDDEYKNRIRKEITTGKKDLETFTGKKIISYAFPFGDYGQNYTNFSESTELLLSEIKKVFPIAFYQVYTGSGYSYNYPDKNEFMMKRIIVRPDWNAEDLLNELEKGRPKKLPFYTEFAKDRGWEKTWGAQSFGDNGLTLKTDNSEGGSVILDGSFAWTDYNFVANVKWDKGDSMSLIARYVNDGNYVACNITDDSIKAQQTIDKKESKLSDVSGQFLLRKDVEFSAGIKVKGDLVECIIDGDTVTSAKLKANSISGGIGFKNWAVEENESRVFIKNIKVEAI